MQLPEDFADGDTLRLEQPTLALNKSTRINNASLYYLNAPIIVPSVFNPQFSIEIA
jgi:hypothetical protein